MLGLALAGWTVSCRGTGAQVSVEPGANLGSRQMVVFRFANTWVANHSVVPLLGQELARRGLAVKLQLEAGEALPGNALVLHLDQAGDKPNEGAGRIDFLSYLDFRLADASGRTLARATYAGSSLDKIGQKSLVAEIAGQLFRDS